MRRWLAGGVCAAGLAWGAAAVALDAYGHRTASGPFDAIVVAGCRVGPDGAPSLALDRRTRDAVALWQEGLAPRILFTGGVGTYPPSEASVGAALAERLGVPREALLMEDQSTSTEENARFSADMIGAQARVLVVTDTYHIYRAERVFGRVFAEARGSGSQPAWHVRGRGALREVAAVAWYTFTGRL